LQAAAISRAGFIGNLNSMINGAGLRPKSAAGG
jgi:hypothetical protein